MVRHYWLVITFGAGLAVGVFIASLHPGSAGTVVVSKDAEPDTRPAPLAAELGVREAGGRKTVPPEADASQVAASEARNSKPGAPAAAHVPIETTLASGPIEIRSDGAYVGGQRVNAEVTFRDSYGEMHEQFEAEARNDSWAYLREAEIENAMVVEISSGKFRKESIECRSTICEVHLTGRGELQSAALQGWYDAMQEQPPGEGMWMSMGSYSREDDTLDVKLILVKRESAAAGGAAPRRN